MRRRQFLALGATLAAAPAVPPLTALAAPVSGVLPPRAQIITLVRRVADRWIADHSDSADNGWARATFFSGLMAAYRLTQEPRYLDYTRRWAEKHSYGIRQGVETRHADNHNAIQAYLDLYELEPSPNKVAAATQADPETVGAVERTLVPRRALPARQDRVPQRQTGALVAR